MRTLADIRPNTQTSVQTDRRADSWRKTIIHQHRAVSTHTYAQVYKKKKTHTLTSLTGWSSPAWQAHTLVRRHTVTSIVTVTAAHHYDQQKISKSICVFKGKYLIGKTGINSCTLKPLTLNKITTGGNNPKSYFRLTEIELQTH